MRRRTFIGSTIAIIGGLFSRLVCVAKPNSAEPDLPKRPWGWGSWPLQPPSHLPCTKCGALVKLEEWMISPYDVNHGTCCKCGPVWLFMPWVSDPERREIQKYPAPYYRAGIPDISRIVNRIACCCLMAGLLCFGCSTTPPAVVPGRVALTDKPLVHPAVLPPLPPNPVKSALLKLGVRTNAPTPPAAVQRFAVLPPPRVTHYAWDPSPPQPYTTIGVDGIVTWHTQNIAYVWRASPTLAPAVWTAYATNMTTFATLPTGPGNGFYSLHAVDVDTGLESP
jgi:hypothetical protein